MERMTLKEPLRLDILAREALGDENSGGLEALLKANRGMADSVFARDGATILIPPKPAPPPVPFVNPWD